MPVSSSFPGRMDWSTNTPIPGDLNGWIVQFGGDSSATSLGNPAYVDIYALCVPGADIPPVAGDVVFCLASGSEPSPDPGPAATWGLTLLGAVAATMTAAAIRDAVRQAG